jgi:hypothetical protein
VVDNDGNCRSKTERNQPKSVTYLPGRALPHRRSKTRFNGAVCICPYEKTKRQIDRQTDRQQTDRHSAKVSAGCSKRNDFTLLPLRNDDPEKFLLVNKQHERAQPGPLLAK